ncbi:MAG TPA: hypothetical protein DCG12_13010 [Planctomycetaceae bacterium]|nr:hypothetical protein [Planctomycetaceae bacterium]|tara:strand:- start:57 stop:305 length:249 start_codon:yes stop_codon:yes gene_type:complete
MKYVVWGLVVLLIILHQDVWLWDNDTLVAGFLPVTLLYHACLSLAAGITWYLATKFAWPSVLEDGPSLDESASEQPAEGGEA